MVNSMQNTPNGVTREILRCQWQLTRRVAGTRRC